MSVVSFNSTKRRAQSSVISYIRFRFTAAYIQINSVLFSSSWLSMLVVINKDSLMRNGLCGKLQVDGRSCCSHFTSHRSDSQIFIENRDFCILDLRRNATVRGRGQPEYCHDVWYEKLEWCGYPMVKNLKISLFVSTESPNVTDGQTDRQTVGQTPHDGIGRAYA